MQSACDTVVTGISALLLENADDPDPVGVGESTVYTVKVTNQGTADDTNVRLVVEFPAELDPVTASDAGEVAGKTVTFYMISGLLRPDSGVITLGGDDVTDLPMDKRSRRGLGYLPQERSIFRHLTTMENVALVYECHGDKGRDAEFHARKLLAKFGLSDLADVRASRLSGGQQRRLEVARATASEPRIILFDEPFAGIDPLTIEMLHAMMLDLKRAGTGVLLTDHNVMEAFAL
jgi:uncharacterized repeat protein (TIGR01451 family)